MEKGLRLSHSRSLDGIKRGRCLILNNVFVAIITVYCFGTQEIISFQFDVHINNNIKAIV